LSANALVGTYLSRSADVGTTIRRDHIVDLVVGNWHPFAVDFDFVVVANHATLGRATIHQVAARTLAIVSFELRVEVLMPFIVTYPIVSVLRCRACKKKHGESTSKQRREVLPRNFIRKFFESIGAVSSSRMRKLRMSTHSGLAATQSKP
jgi:hypothetical protein